ncbi:MAG: nucleoside deaminase [Armatimonadetes bacterium]|nr:nucleoside deaminase [Armatimonadota bacterium]
MRVALRLAARAGARGEVPVGALVVRDGKVLGRAANNRERRRDFLGHAEIVAMRRACKQAGDWRLDGATVYVTLEPCPMCVGAMLGARIARVVYGASDPACGAAGTVVDLADYPGMSHHIDWFGGVYGRQSRRLIEDFFRQRRAEGRSEGTTE